MTMTNAEWCIKNGYKFRDIDASRKNDSNWEFEFKIRSSDHLYRKIGYLKTYNSMYPSEAVLEWLDMEHKKPILDDAEKKYLSAVIKPFRKTVMWIKKYSGTYSGVNYESIVVCVEGDFVRKTSFSFGLPSFKPGTMYKGMTLNRKYTLEELGL